MLAISILTEHVQKSIAGKAKPILTRLMRIKNFYMHFSGSLGSTFYHRLNLAYYYILVYMYCVN